MPQTNVPTIKNLIRRMKGIPDSHGVRWPIRDAGMHVIGYMRAFDRTCLGDSELIETMAAWHTAYKESFLTQFVVTPDNKRSWLESSILENDLKMLFLIETVDGRVVGQDGFTIDGDGTYCLDGTMRWGRNVPPNLFRRSIIERVAIGYYLLACRRCTAEIFKDNVPALDNVLALGFEAEDEVSLSRVTEDSVVRYVAGDFPSSASDRILVKTAMKENYFSAHYGTIVKSPSWGNFESELRGVEDH